MSESSIPPATDASRAPNVLQIVPALDGGGVARAAVDTAAAVVAAGGRAVIAAPAAGAMLGELRRLKVPLLSVPADRDGLVAAWSNARRLREAMTEHGIDIVHARSRAAAWTARHLTRAAAVKFVATAHRPTRAESWAGRRMEAAQAQADRVIAVSDFVARDIAARHAPPDGRLVTIRAGINLDRFNPATVRAERVIKLASQWRLPDDRRVVLFPGRLTENRGQRRLIEAVRALGRSDIYCLLVGAGDPPSSFESTLKRDIETAGLGGIVGLAPYCADMPAAYMLADVVVAGGGGQGFSRIIVEAQAMSRPVVCDADGGAVEGMVPDETGWAAASDDPAALARALDTALGLSPERRAVLSHRAQRHVRENFTTEAMCRRTLELYADVLDRAPAHAAA